VFGDYNFEHCELLCPVCGKYIDLVLNPTPEEARANWDKLSDFDRELFEKAERFRSDHARRKLRNASELPNVTEQSFTLSWDFADYGSHRDILIRHGEAVIFAEPALYEGYERFVEVAEMLRSRYGTALRDLVPTAASELYLYGDYSSAPAIVRQARRRIFGIAGD
jgi:hypothetical protein